MRNPYGAIFSPHCAVVDPARLVRGLALAVERKGVTIPEHTPVRDLGHGAVRTDRGTVRATFIVPATEGYSATIQGLGHYLLPVTTLIIAPEPWSGARGAERRLKPSPPFSDAVRRITT